MDPEITKLLALQEEDAQRIEAERQLAGIPVEIASLEKKIAAEKEQLAAAQGEHRALELRRSDMRTQRLADEEQIAKYKNQQINVKKNEEYTALSHEIDQLTEKIGANEENEIALLMEIDEFAEKLKEIEAEVQKRIKLFEGEIENIRKREAISKANLANLQDKIATLSVSIARNYLSAYENVKRRYKRPPFVVPIIDHKAGGLRVSGEAVSAARKANNVITDENSGRIVYWPE